MFSKPTFDVTTFVLCICLECLTLGCGGPTTIEEDKSTIADSGTPQTAAEQPDELAADLPATLGTPEELAAADLTPEELAAADLATSEELAAAGLTPEELAGADLPTELTRSAVAKPPSSVGGMISRGEILKRAMFWVNRHVPYDPRGTYPDPQGKMYRTDRPGFVSMSLHLPVSANTFTLKKYVHAIGWSDLRPGDIVTSERRIRCGPSAAYDRVMIFHSWVSPRHTAFRALEMSRQAITSTFSVAFAPGCAHAEPYRYNNVIR